MCAAFSTSTPTSVSGIDKHWVNVSHKGWIKGWLHGIWQLALNMGSFLWNSDGKQWGRRHYLVPLCFLCSIQQVESLDEWLIFTYSSTITAHTNWGKDSALSWALDISHKNNFCAFGLEARSPETLILALTMTWVTSAGKAFWDRPLERLWCFVGCLNKMHNPDNCTVSEPRMGFGTGSTLNGDVA